MKPIKVCDGCPNLKPCLSILKFYINENNLQKVKSTPENTTQLFNILKFCTKKSLLFQMHIFSIPREVHHPQGHHPIL
jgi:hypothetical protein